MASLDGRATPAFAAFAAAGRAAAPSGPTGATTGKQTLVSQLAAAPPERFASPPPPSPPPGVTPTAAPVAKLGLLDVAGRRPATKSTT